jgi:hypothetical protein
MSFSLFSIVQQGIRSVCQALAQRLRQWTKPDNHAPTLNTAVDLTRSRTELVLKNYGGRHSHPLRSVADNLVPW